jgi:hypothetical protein
VPDWAFAPGDTIERTELHCQFGGSRQSGISPSCRSLNVFFFSDKSSGEQHGRASAEASLKDRFVLSPDSVEFNLIEAL